MGSMIKLHLRIVVWVLVVVGLYLLSSWIMQALFELTIPTCILLIAIAGCMLIDAYLRIKHLKDQNWGKSKDERASVQKRIIMMAVPAEILFALLCLLSLSGK